MKESQKVDSNKQTNSEIAPKSASAKFISCVNQNLETLLFARALDEYEFELELELVR